MNCTIDNCFSIIVMTVLLVPTDGRSSDIDQTFDVDTHGKVGSLGISSGHEKEEENSEKAETKLDVVIPVDTGK